MLYLILCLIIYTKIYLIINFKENIFMKCPFCNYKNSKVLDSRATEEGSSIRRRRECLNCQKRFTTYETIESTPLLVVKNDGSRQPFDIEKVKKGIIKACEKRPVSLNTIDEICYDIEKQLQNRLEGEISASEIGEMVMKRLRAIDEVAYIRFASVYRKFEDIHTFMEELNRLQLENKSENEDSLK